MTGWKTGGTKTSNPGLLDLGVSTSLARFTCPRGTKVILKPLCNLNDPSWINSPRARADGEFRGAPHLSRGQVSYSRKLLSAHVGQHAFRRPLPTEHNHGAKEAAHARARAGLIGDPPSRGPQLPLGCNASRGARAVQASSIPPFNYRTARD